MGIVARIPTLVAALTLGLILSACTKKEEAATPSATPEATAPSATPEATAPSATPEATAPSATPEATAPSATPEAAAPETVSAVSAPVADASSALAADGKELYNSKCAGCHGLNAEGQNGFPRLAGLSSDEISNKLKDYRAGKQMGPRTAIMAVNAMNLADKDIAALAAYLSNLGS